MILPMDRSGKSRLCRPYLMISRMKIHAPIFMFTLADDLCTDQTGGMTALLSSDLTQKQVTLSLPVINR